MKLIVNKLAVARSSRGVRRYYGSLSSPLLGSVAGSGWQVGSLDASFSASLDRMREWSFRSPRASVFWSPCQRGSLVSEAQVITVHDCINVEQVRARDWRVGAYRALFTRVLQRARRVVAISEATRVSILRNYDVDASKTVVIQSAVALPVAALQAAPTLSLIHI